MARAAPAEWCYDSDSKLSPQQQEQRRVDDAHNVSSTFGMLGEELVVHSTRGGRHVDLVEHNAVDGGEAPGLLEWWNVAMIQLAEVVGMAILTMPVAFAQLGWIPSLALLAINGAGSVFVGHALRRAKLMFPGANSFTLMAKYTTGSTAFVLLVRVFTVTVLFIAVSGYLMSIAQALPMVFLSAEVCAPVWALAAAGMLLLCFPVRSLGGRPVAIIMWFNALSIAAVVVACVAVLLSSMSEQHAVHPVRTELFATNMTWVSFFTGASQISTAFLGQFVFLEVMDEMREPDDFMKSFRLSLPFQLGAYLICGCAGYAYMGAQASDSIIKELSPYTHATVLQVVAILLIFHMCSAYLINGLVLCRKVHKTFSPSTFYAQSRKAWGIWLAVCFAVIGISYAIINVVPSFGWLMGIAGSLVSPALMYIFPFIFWTQGARVTREDADDVEVISIPSRMAIVLLSLWAFTLLFAGTAACFTSAADAFSGGQTPFACDPTSYFDKYNATAI
jgi:amino acid permease